MSKFTSNTVYIFEDRVEIGCMDTPEQAARIVRLLQEGEWQPIETAPKDGYFIVVNALGEVASCEASGLGRLVSGKWTFGQNATHWQALPDPPAESAPEPEGRKP